MRPVEKIYTGNHKGQTAIICGSAPCLLKEFEEVRKHRQDAKVIGINEAVWLIWCDYLMTYHADETPRFIKKSLNKDIIIHTSKEYSINYGDKAHYFWTDILLGGTSTGDAIQICSKMGFDEIILCGAPMNGGDGYFHSEVRENVSGCPRFGNFKTDDGFIKSHQKKLTQLKDRIDISKVKSMSGYSAQVFGKPIWH